MIAPLKKKKWPALTLGNEYFIYSLIILLTVFIVSVFLYCCTYSFYIQEKNQKLHQVSDNLQQEISELFDKGKLRVELAANMVVESNKKLDMMTRNLGMHFIVFDEHCNVLLQSISDTQQTKLSLDKNICHKTIWNSMKGSTEFLSPFGSEIKDYVYFQKLKNNPNIVIFTSFDKNMLEKDLHRQLFPLVCELIVIALFCIVLLYFFRRKIITPITTLSNYANLIAKGKTHIKIPKQKSIELYNLAKSLVLVKHYIKRNETYRCKLEEANEIIKTSAEAREDFIKSINQELTHPLKEILICAEILKSNIEEQAVIAESGIYLKCLEKIREAVSNIKAKTSSALNLSFFDFNVVINQALQINMKQSFAKKLQIKTNLIQDLPGLYGDALKIKQILVFLLSQAIENSMEGQEIILSTNIIDKNDINYIEFALKDFGFGLSEEELKRIQKNIGWIEERELFTQMEHSFIEKVMQLHQGHLSVESKMYEGQTVYLQFPLQISNCDNNEQGINNIYYLSSKQR